MRRKHGVLGVPRDEARSLEYTRKALPWTGLVLIRWSDNGLIRSTAQGNHARANRSPIAMLVHSSRVRAGYLSDADAEIRTLVHADLAPVIGTSPPDLRGCSSAKCGPLPGCRPPVAAPVSMCGPIEIDTAQVSLLPR